MKTRSEYDLMARCVTDATYHVWRRAFKHDENAPVISDDQMKTLQEAMLNEVMNEISEWFTFSERE